MSSRGFRGITPEPVAREGGAFVFTATATYTTMGARLSSSAAFEHMLTDLQEEIKLKLNDMAHLECVMGQPGMAWTYDDVVWHHYPPGSGGVSDPMGDIGRLVGVMKVRPKPLYESWTKDFLDATTRDLYPAASGPPVWVDFAELGSYPLDAGAAAVLAVVRETDGAFSVNGRDGWFIARRGSSPPYKDDMPVDGRHVTHLIDEGYLELCGGGIWGSVSWAICSASGALILDELATAMVGAPGRLKVPMREDSDTVERYWSEVERQVQAFIDHKRSKDMEERVEQYKRDTLGRSPLEDPFQSMGQVAAKHSLAQQVMTKEQLARMQAYLEGQRDLWSDRLIASRRPPDGGPAGSSGDSVAKSRRYGAIARWRTKKEDGGGG